MRKIALPFLIILFSLPFLKGEKLNYENGLRFSKLALKCIDREYPNKPADVLNSSEDVTSTKEKHPVFFGCFDYHSSVHGHWMLLKIAKLFPDTPLSKKIYERLDEHFKRNKLLREAKYFENPYTKSFERPYGWGWLLRLILEIREKPQNEYTKKWEEYFLPLEKVMVKRFTYYLKNLTHPIRSSEHSNTAFALAQAYDYARYVKNEKLKKLIEEKAKEFYLKDVNYPIEYEPDGEAFLSPALTEADLMVRILPEYEFNTWFQKFIPIKKLMSSKNFLMPQKVSNIEDPKLIHIDGLNLSRAWALKDIYEKIKNSRLRKILEKSFREHEKYGLKHVMSKNYGGEHWLASFAVYLLTVKPLK